MSKAILEPLVLKVTQVTMVMTELLVHKVIQVPKVQQVLKVTQVTMVMTELRVHKVQQVLVEQVL